MNLYVCQITAMTKHVVTQWREENGISQEQLGEILDLSRWTINQIENGGRMPSWKSLVKWEEVTGIPRHELRPDIYGPKGDAA